MAKNKLIYNQIQKNTHLGLKQIAILLDPDKVNFDTLPDLIQDCILNKINYFLVGGSLITGQSLENLIATIKQNCDIPVIIFPGNSLHISNKADGILFLSLISGRNPEFLIGQQVISAPILKKSGLEVISTGYILVESGKQTTVSYISNTTPIPNDKSDIAVCTAMAGEMLGLSLIYMDAGSGAKMAISPNMIEKVKEAIDSPLIIGGGINTIEKAEAAFLAGADIIVVGNKIEENPDFLNELGKLNTKFNGDLAQISY